MIARLATTKEIKGILRACKSVGAEVERNVEAGTVKVFYQHDEMFWAIQKGIGGNAWICRFNQKYFK